MKNFESSEDYLERILMLKNKNGKVRSIDIVDDMNFSRASVSVAMKKFKENNYIVFDEDGYIDLTNDGYKIASSIYERHMLIANLLMEIGVSSNQAFDDACKIEHNLSQESFLALKSHYNNIKK